MTNPFSNFESLEDDDSDDRDDGPTNRENDRADTNRPTSTRREPAASQPAASPPPVRYEPVRMRIMRVAVRLPTTFTKENLAVACWETYPEDFGFVTSDGKSWPDHASLCSKLYGASGLIASGNIVQDGKLLSVSPVTYDRLSPVRREHFDAKELLKRASDVLHTVRATPQSPQLDAQVDELLAAFDAFRSRA